MSGAIRSSRATSGSSRATVCPTCRSAGRALRPGAARPLAEGAVRDRAVRRRRDRPRRQHAGRPGHREPDHQPDRLRGKQADRATKTLSARSSSGRASVYTRARVQNDVSASSSSTAATAASPPRSSPRSSSSTRTASIWCSRSTRAPRTGVARINFVGNQQFSDSTLRGVIQTKESRWYRFLTTRRHLRSRPAHLRPRAAAQVLPVRGLRRFPRRLGGRRADARPRRLLHHLHDRRGRALQVRQGRRRDRAQGPRRRRAAAAILTKARATGTMPRRSRRRSRR